MKLPNMPSILDRLRRYLFITWREEHHVLYPPCYRYYLLFDRWQLLRVKVDYCSWHLRIVK